MIKILIYVTVLTLRSTLSVFVTSLQNFSFVFNSFLLREIFSSFSVLVKKQTTQDEFFIRVFNHVCCLCIWRPF